MSLEAVITEAIHKVISAKEYSVITEGVVVAVDKVAKTCDITREDLPEIFHIRLSAIVDARGTFTMYPKVGSVVLVGIVENVVTDAVVLSVSEVDDIIFNDGTNGGLVIVGEAVSQIQEIKDDLNSLKTAVGGWIPVPQDGGAALKTALTNWSTATLADVDANAMQNEKFKH